MAFITLDELVALVQVELGGRSDSANPSHRSDRIGLQVPYVLREMAEEAITDNDLGAHLCNDYVINGTTKVFASDGTFDLAQYPEILIRSLTYSKAKVEIGQSPNTVYEGIIYQATHDFMAGTPHPDFPRVMVSGTHLMTRTKGITVDASTLGYIRAAIFVPIVGLTSGVTTLPTQLEKPLIDRLVGRMMAASAAHRGVSNG